MSKRTANSDLNHDNWDQDEPPEEPGNFIPASKDVIEKRVIRTAKRRIASSSADKPEGERKAFTGFGGFGNLGRQESAKTDFIKTDFSFLTSTANGFSNKKLPGTLDEKKASLSPLSMTAKKGEEENLSEFYAKRKELNESVLAWISGHVKKDPYCILSPIFKDYEKHLETINKEEAEARSSKPSVATAGPAVKTNGEKPSAALGSTLDLAADKTTSTSSLPTFKFSSTQEAAPVVTSPFGQSPLTKPGVPKASETGGSGLSALASLSTPATTTSGFSFTGGKPFMFGNVSSVFSETKEKQGVAEAGSSEGTAEEEPPKNDFKQVTEDDVVFSQRVKVFVKKDGQFTERGVGMFYIKEAKGTGSKHQALVRADTSLGNILFNILLTEAVPSQRVGKNNVMLVCIPTPDAKPPPVPVLLRVKTSGDADNLLAQIDKYKK